MGFKVQVVDGSGYPKKSYQVRVKWSDKSSSSGSTGSDGIYDTGVEKGLVTSITVFGRTKNISIQANKNNDIFKFVYV